MKVCKCGCGNEVKEGNVYLQHHAFKDRQVQSELAKRAVPVRAKLGWEGSGFNFRAKVGNFVGQNNPRFGAHLSEATRKQISESNSIVRLGHIHSEMTKSKMSNMRIKWIKNHPQEWEEALQKMYRTKRPTLGELDLAKFLYDRFPGQFIYTGDGRQCIGTRNPDFLHLTLKKVIEYNGCIHNNDSYEHVQKKLEDYHDYGYEVIFVWPSELRKVNIDKTTHKVMEFINGGDAK